MNDATKCLFEYAEEFRHSEFDIKFSNLTDKVKAFVDAGADINAVNEDGFDILQVAVGVESPSESIADKIDSECGYDKEAFFIDACLQNGFACSKDFLTALLKIYCYESYSFEAADPLLICTLLKKGADWNCEQEPYLLEVIAGNEIIWREDNDDFIKNNLKDWRYDMLCAYYNAGGDLYVKNSQGKYVWESPLSLTALAFFLEKNVDIPSAVVENSITTCAYGELVDSHCLIIDSYADQTIEAWLRHPKKLFFPSDIPRYEKIINLLVDYLDKYPCISNKLLETLPGVTWAIDFDNYENDGYAKHFSKDFYKPAKLFLQMAKDKYGDLRKIADKIGDYCSIHGCSDLSELFDFILPDYPEFVEYFPWSKVCGNAWAWLLNFRYSRFADKCDWEKLNGVDWVNLLGVSPQFADKCDWTKLSEEDWFMLLVQQPQLEKYRK